MFTSHRKRALGLVLAVGILTLGGIAIGHAVKDAPAPEVRKAPKELLEERRDSAKRAYAEKLQRLKHGIRGGQPSDLFGWSERWLDAELALCEKKEDRIALLTDHVDRTREVERMAVGMVSRGLTPNADGDAATYERTNAEIRYFEATGKAPPPPPKTKVAPPRPKNETSAEPAGESLEPPPPKKKERRPIQKEDAKPAKRDPKEAAAPKGHRELFLQRFHVAERLFKSRLKQLTMQERVFPSDLFGWSERILDAEMTLSDKKEDQIAALKAHMHRTREVERMAIIRAFEGTGTQDDANAATYDRINADIRYCQATGKVPPTVRIIRKDSGSGQSLEIREEPPGDPLSPLAPKKKKSDP